MYLALKAGGLEDDKLQMLKLFVMNRIIPKCKLKEICEHLQIHLKLTSIKHTDSSTTRVELFGDKTHTSYHLGLVDEQYFIIDKTNITSYCLLNYTEVKHVNNCNKIWRKLDDGKYNKSNDKFIDSYKLFKILLEHKDTLLKPILYNEEIMNTQFYDKVIEFNTLEYPASCVKYVTYEPKNNTDYYKILFDFETITGEGNHEPYWLDMKQKTMSKKFLQVKHVLLIC